MPVENKKTEDAIVARLFSLQNSLNLNFFLSPPMTVSLSLSLFQIGYNCFVLGA